MADLKLGNVFNRVTPGNEVEQARNLGFANIATGIADTLSGKDFQPGMSGFEQAMVAGARGAATGFQNKAAMQKAQAQEEMNAWAKSLADDEAARAKALDFAEKEKTAISRASIPALSAYQEYKKTGDKAAFEARLKSIGTSFASSLGTELTNLHLDPNSDQIVVMTLKDIDGDGQQDTQRIDLADLIGPATELNADFAKGMLPVFGVTPPSKASEDVTFEQFKSFTPEEQAAYERFTGKGGKTDKSKGVSSARERILGTAGSEATQKEDAEILNGFDQRAVSANALKRLQQGLAEGIRTGGLTEITADSISVVNTLLGTNIKMPADIAEFRSLLKDQLGSALQIYGAGTGISNRDVISAEQTIGTVDTPKEALQKILAGMSARLEATDEYANKLEQLILEEDAGRITPAESDARRAELRTKFRARLAELYNQKLDESLAMEQNFMRTGSTSGAATPQEIEIDLDGNIIQ